MAKKSNGFEEYENKLKKVKLSDGLYSRKNLPIPNHEETIAELVAAGEKIIEEEEKLRQKTVVSETKRLETKLGSTSSNPYIRARCDILTKMTESARSVIEKMEKGLLDKDHRYDTFVKDVTKLGDELSSENN